MAVIANASSLLFRAEHLKKDPELSFLLFLYPSHFFGVIVHAREGIVYLRQYDRRPDSDNDIQIDGISEDLKSEWNDILSGDIEIRSAGSATLAAVPETGLNDFQSIELAENCFFCAQDAQHPHFAWLNSAIAQQWQEGMYIEFAGSVMSTFVKDAHQIRIYNQFDIQGSKDAMYYILLIYKQLKLDIEKDPVFVGGAVSADSEVMDWLKKYIRHVSLFNGKKRIEAWPFKVHDIPWHFYPSLICHLSCE